MTVYTPIWIAMFKALSVTHTFQYNDLPYLYTEKRNDPTRFLEHHVKPESEDSDDFESGVNHVINKIMPKLCGSPFGFGFDLENEVMDKKNGVYSITHRDSHMFASTLFMDNKREAVTERKVWIELYVEKRIHPVFSSLIEAVKKELKQINSAMSNYSKDALIEVTKNLEEKSAFKDINNEDLFMKKLCELLEKKLAEGEKHIKNLQERILGYETNVTEVRKELYRKKIRYAMMGQLSVILQGYSATPFIKDFIRDLDVFFQKPTTKEIDTVWGRKQTSNVQPEYTVLRAKVKGMAIGAFFKPSDKPNSIGWLGKLGDVAALPLEPGLSTFSRVRRGSALESILEKIAADLYAYLSDGEYIVPKTRLAELPIKNQFTKDNALTEELFNEINYQRQTKVNEGIYVMSKFIENYQDLAELTNCVIDEQSLDFEECLNLGRVPEYVGIEGEKVPLKGLMEILAISRLLADTDVLGGSAKNAGFLIERNANGEPKSVRAVKVDPGYAFNFIGPQNLFHQSQLPHAWDTNLLKKEPRHLQYSNLMPPLPWNNLTELQQQQFIIALDFGLKMLKGNNEVFKKFMDRDDFNETPKNKLQLPKVRKYWECLQNNLTQQEKVYEEELKRLNQEKFSY